MVPCAKVYRCIHSSDLQEIQECQYVDLFFLEFPKSKQPSYKCTLNAFSELHSVRTLEVVELREAVSKMLKASSWSLDHLTAPFETSAWTMKVPLAYRSGNHRLCWPLWQATNEGNLLTKFPGSDSGGTLFECARGPKAVWCFRSVIGFVFIPTYTTVIRIAT